MLKSLFKAVDNAPLIVFRIFFGLIVFIECIRTFNENRINAYLLKPKVNFTFIGFEWLNFLKNDYLYVHYVLMMIAALFVAIGFKYRWSTVLLTIGWSCIYFMQKTDYRHHYYLIWLICIIMCFMPADKYASADAKINPEIKVYAMPQWISFLFILQIACVYIFASFCKFNPEWLDGSFIDQLFSGRRVYNKLSPKLNTPWFHQLMSYLGILFDALIIPAMLWIRTRWLAVFAAVFFHMFNAYFLGIGIFPFLSLAFTVFFFKPEEIRKFFLRKKPVLTEELKKYHFKDYHILFYVVIVPYVLLQLLLPVRHLAIEGPVMWTTEGDRLSWRVMLNYRLGTTRYKVVDKATGQQISFKNKELLTDYQILKLNTPDVIWQMAQFIKEYYKKQGIDVSVYAARSNVTINRRPAKRLIDPTVDLTAVPWSHFRHHDWILSENDPKWNQDAPKQNYKIQKLTPIKKLDL